MTPALAVGDEFARRQSIASLVRPRAHCRLMQVPHLDPEFQSPFPVRFLNSTTWVLHLQRKGLHRCLAHRKVAWVVGRSLLPRSTCICIIGAQAKGPQPAPCLTVSFEGAAYRSLRGSVPRKDANASRHLGTSMPSTVENIPRHDWDISVQSSGETSPVGVS